MNKEQIQKIQDAVIDMMNKVKFIDEKNQHRYETLDGVWLQGVSEVSSIIPKDWLSAWGAKEAVKFLGYSDYKEDTERAEEMLATIQCLRTDEESGVVEKYLAILKEAKGASFRKSKEALVDGTAGHLWLSQFVLAEIRRSRLDIKSYKELTKEEQKEINEYLRGFGLFFLDE